MKTSNACMCMPVVTHTCVRTCCEYILVVYSDHTSQTWLGKLVGNLHMIGRVADSPIDSAYPGDHCLLIAKTRVETGGSEPLVTHV